MTKRSQSSQFCAEQLRLLADSTRMAIMARLLRGSCYVGQLQQELGVEQSLLSHHLSVLRRAGLIESAREGRAVRYAVAESARADGQSPAIDLGCCRLVF